MLSSELTPEYCFGKGRENHSHGKPAPVGVWSKFRNVLGLKAREGWIPGSPLYLDLPAGDQHNYTGKEREKVV